MFAKSIIVSLFLAATARAQLGISTPSELKQCEEAVFTVTGANGATLYPFIVEASKPCEDALAEPEPFTGDFKYTPKLPVGTTIMVAIENDDEQEAWSGALTIVEGDSDACLTSASTSPSKSGSGSAPENTLGVDTPENAVDAPVVDGNSASRLVSGGFSVVAAIVAFSALAL